MVRVPLTCTRPFFDLQLRFARKVAALSGMLWERALLDYTNLYVRFGLGRDFDPAHPVWREYLAGLRGPLDEEEWTYRFYRTRTESPAGPAPAITTGCFWYSRLDDDRIRLHFQNAETEGRSPLGLERLDRRMADLAALFHHVRRTQARPPRVVGASWLYNLPAYRRLFPPSYLATARVIDHRFRSMPLWGQFLDRRGEIREPARREFLERLERQSTMDRLDLCFPLQVLALEASATEFYDFYRI
jgi:hypothetical protein